ncbi:MAG TPA: polymer-forming cytoskeletal protein, partial [Spirochaetota bacterium]|nr:polymer-forming cytoskeletal protein [Spirochaetota bacterium]
TNGKVLIGQSGDAITDIKARLVVVGGKVSGNIYATERIILLSTGEVKGNIIAPSLVMEEGVKFEGNCLINKKLEENSD